MRKTFEKLVKKLLDNFVKDLDEEDIEEAARAISLLEEELERVRQHEVDTAKVAVRRIESLEAEIERMEEELATEHQDTKKIELDLEDAEEEVKSLKRDLSWHGELIKLSDKEVLRLREDTYRNAAVLKALTSKAAVDAAHLTFCAQREKNWPLAGIGAMRVSIQAALKDAQEQVGK